MLERLALPLLFAFLLAGCFLLPFVARLRFVTVLNGLSHLTRVINGLSGFCQLACRGVQERPEWLDARIKQLPSTQCGQYAVHNECLQHCAEGTKGRQR